MTATQHKHINLQTDQLTVGYFNAKELTPVLENISIKAYAGELICFMGPNGVGKSTLLRTICNLQKPLSGSISIEGIDINQLNAQAMAQAISLVLTDSINAGNLTAYELVALGRYPYLGWNLKVNDTDQNKIDHAIAQAGIESYVRKKIYELSDGQLQKVMIARALAQDTPLLILDEPTAHLDLNNRVAIVNLLKKLARDENKTIIMATHELDLALQSADKLWLAGYNKPIIEGIPEDLVLNGSIDEVFQLKGYDLKTGTLKKESMGRKVNLSGSGHTYLWTKNALERNGYEIDTLALTHITIDDETNYWKINKDVTAHTLEDLIKQLNQTIL